MKVYQEVSRKITATPVNVPEDTEENLLDWMVGNAPLGAKWLLAHCYDGIVWGKRENGVWALSSDVAPEISPQLSMESLLQIRMFGEAGELFIWRSGEGFRGRKVQFDEAGKEFEGFIEKQWLWGTQPSYARAKNTDFTILSDGAQGLQHAVPFTVPKSHFSTQRDNYRPVRLRVEHYFFQDEETGLAEVWLSVLTDVFSESKVMSQEAGK
jgi:CRISPR-associated protein (TIGR03984 family)